MILRDTGVSHDNFIQIIKLVKEYLDIYFTKYPNKSKGLKPSVNIEDGILLTLYYLRHYVTFQNIGDNFGLSESYANKLYHRTLDILLKVLHVEGHKALMNKDIDTIVVDVSEQPIECPVKGQKKYYSGKKRHTVKVQIIIDLFTSQILCILVEKGSVHDFKIFKNNTLSINPSLMILADLGYLGLDKIHANSWIPHKQ